LAVSVDANIRKPAIRPSLIVGTLPHSLRNIFKYRQNTSGHNASAIMRFRPGIGDGRISTSRAGDFCDPVSANAS
jgi:hypothetical protein